MPVREDVRVALLRGINVGHAKRLAMADLRALVEDLGYGDVRTLLNSARLFSRMVTRACGLASAQVTAAKKPAAPPPRMRICGPSCMRAL